MRMGLPVIYKLRLKKVYKMDYAKALDEFYKAGLQFDLVILDPPYGLKINESIIQYLHEHNMLNDDCILVVEDLNEEIRSHIDDEIAAVYEAIGEQPPGSVGGNLGDRVTVLEEANVQLESNLSWIMGQLEQPPSYSAPTASLSISPNRTIHNESTRITITPSFSRRDGGDMISYTLRRGNDVLIESTSLQSYTDTVTLQHGGSNASYSMTVTYGDGPIKNTNTGRPYPETSIKAGSVSANASIRAYAYSYYGAINSAVVSKPIVNTTPKTKDIIYSVN